MSFPCFCIQFFDVFLDDWDFCFNGGKWEERESHCAWEEVVQHSRLVGSGVNADGDDESGKVGAFVTVGGNDGEQCVVGGFCSCEFLFVAFQVGGALKIVEGSGG